MPGFLKRLLLRLKIALMDWTRPTSFPTTAASITDLTRTRTDLLIENALLRHQIVVLTRHSKRPPLTNSDRFVFVLIARCTRFSEHAFVIVQPQTLLRWHRDLFRH